MDRNRVAGWASAATAVLLAINLIVYVYAFEWDPARAAFDFIFLLVLGKFAVKTLRDDEALTRKEWAVWGVLMLYTWIGLMLVAVFYAPVLV